MAKAECLSCAWESKTGRKIDTSMSKTKWATEVGTSEASVRRHLKNAHEASSGQSDPFYKETREGNSGTIEVTLLEPLTQAEILKKFRKDSDDIKIVGILGESHWGDDERGYQHSYRFQTEYKTADDVDVEDLISVIDKWKPPRFAVGLHGNETLVICPADQQFGKVDWNGGHIETLERVLESYSKAAEIARKGNFSEIVIAELGDSVENNYSTSSQRGTNDLAITEQIRIARRVALEGIKMLAPLTGKLTYAAVPSNHGSVRIGPKSPENHVLDDYGIEIAHQLHDVAENSEKLQNVNFVVPEFNYESLLLETNGTKLGMAHGHQANGADGLGNWWKGQSHGHMPMADADIALFGHFHSFRVQQSGNARWLFVSPSQDNSSSWFTNKTGERSVTGFLSFVTSSGSWSDLKIL